MDLNPFVPRLGEHLRADGTVCMCTRGVRRDYRLPQRPAVEPPKPKRVLTWFDRERAEAEQGGISVWVHSENGGNHE